MTLDPGLLLDGVIALLLAATIVYAARLSRRLARLRDAGAGLEEASRGFTQAAQLADQGIKGLRRAADEAGQALKASTDGARHLRDELAFLVETAESLALRLEQAGTALRTSAAPGAAPREGAGPARAPREVLHPARPADRAPRAKPDAAVLQAIESLR